LFASSRWSLDQLGVAVLAVLVTLLVGPAEPLLVVVDDSRVKRRFKRRGRKVYGSAMHSDPTATGRRTVWGNNWVVVGILVALPAVPTAGCACRWGPAVAAPPPQGHQATPGPRVDRADRLLLPGPHGPRAR
jgi:hypothetical protein